MKKIILFVSAIVLGCFAVSCNFSKSDKLETKIKASMKKEAKLNGVKLNFNELECIELDTIPNEFNTPYLTYMFDSNYYLGEAKNKIENSNFALRWGDYCGKTAKELMVEADSFISLANAKHKVAIEEYSLHKKTCYLVYVDVLTKIANVPIRTQEIALYTYNKNKKDFDMLYHSESNCQERFNKYK